MILQNGMRKKNKKEKERMERILFGGKRTRDGVWIFGSLISIGDYYAILEEDSDEGWDSIYLDKDTGCIDGYATPVDPKTIVRFTGLIDRNDRQIFEGDIVELILKRHDWDVVGEKLIVTEVPSDRYIVEFSKGRGGWYPFANGDGCGCCEEHTIAPSDEGRVSVRVIGNIYDNPELLETVINKKEKENE